MFCLCLTALLRESRLACSACGCGCGGAYAIITSLNATGGCCLIWIGNIKLELPFFSARSRKWSLLVSHLARNTNSATHLRRRRRNGRACETPLSGTQSAASSESRPDRIGSDRSVTDSIARTLSKLTQQCCGKERKKIALKVGPKLGLEPKWRTKLETRAWPTAESEIDAIRRAHSLRLSLSAGPKSESCHRCV